MDSRVQNPKGTFFFHLTATGNMYKKEIILILASYKLLISILMYNIRIKKHNIFLLNDIMWLKIHMYFLLQVIPIVPTILSNGVFNHKLE